PLDGPVRAGAAPRPAPGASGPTVEPLGRTALATYSHAVPPPPSRRPLLPALPPGTGAGASGSLDSRHACCMVALAAVEVLAGVRPLAQLARWLTPDVYDGLARRAALTVPRGSALGMPGGRRATVRRVRVCPVDEQVVEASVVVAHAGRVRGVAVRLTRASGRWRAAALVVG
ncbi:Rv3235 family protein, partial [Cellulomonas triticagri]|uniref:Rv3235 family protein n=1 Tax=Cellulomonas triticagri TaxID=2483352 RepID=UPI0013154165